MLYILFLLKGNVEKYFFFKKLSPEMSFKVNFKFKKKHKKKNQLITSERNYKVF